MNKFAILEDLAKVRELGEDIEEIVNETISRFGFTVKSYESVFPGYDHIIKLRAFNKAEDRWEDIEIHYGQGSPGYEHMMDTYVFRTWRHV